MSNKTKHTPTPWRVIKNGRIVWHKGGDIGEIVVRSGNYDEAQANAEHIVKCVNSHDALIEALKGLVDWVMFNTDAIPYDLTRARQALEQAEE